MRTFGGFRSGDKSFYGELRGDEVHALVHPYWIDIEPMDEVWKLADVNVDLPVASSKLIAVGLNDADHNAEKKLTAFDTTLIRLKAPSSLLPHNDGIQIALAGHQPE